MGFQLFESSGTFNPTAWGLKAGDVLTVICVGGGGSSTTAGEASSFGNILTAAGGTAAGAFGYGGDGGYCPGNPISMGRSIISSTSWSGAAAGGSESSDVCPWYGGIGSQYSITHTGSYNDGSWTRHVVEKTITSGDGNFQGIGGTGATAYGYSHAINTSITSSLSLKAGGGGAGYGAGGGGYYAYAKGEYGDDRIHIAGPFNKKGGGAGQYKITQYKLTSVDNIAITIGEGAPATTTEESSSQTYAKCSGSGGAGANGCVCVFW